MNASIAGGLLQGRWNALLGIPVSARAYLPGAGAFFIGFAAGIGLVVSPSGNSLFKGGLYLPCV